ncbi:MAG: hypothetical protein RL181_2099 [Bacteroidota bacterium]|jgi:hypothetical protein
MALLRQPLPHLTGKGILLKSLLSVSNTHR